MRGRDSARAHWKLDLVGRKQTSDMAQQQQRRANLREGETVEEYKSCFIIKLISDATNVRSFCPCLFSNSLHLIIQSFARDGPGSSLQNDCRCVALRDENGDLRQ